MSIDDDGNGPDDKPEHMTEFERGVRFVIERFERYSRGNGPDVTQFGDYQMTMVECPSSHLTKGSADHRERRIQAMLHLGRRAIGACHDCGAADAPHQSVGNYIRDVGAGEAHKGSDRPAHGATPDVEGRDA
jgi:hypothetical protein